MCLGDERAHGIEHERREDLNKRDKRERRAKLGVRRTTRPAYRVVAKVELKELVLAADETRQGANEALDTWADPFVDLLNAQRRQRREERARVGQAVPMDQRMSLHFDPSYVGEQLLLVVDLGLEERLRVVLEQTQRGRDGRGYGGKGFGAETTHWAVRAHS